MADRPTYEQMVEAAAQDIVDILDKGKEHALAVARTVLNTPEIAAVLTETIGRDYADTDPKATRRGIQAMKDMGLRWQQADREITRLMSEMWADAYSDHEEES